MLDAGQRDRRVTIVRRTVVMDGLESKPVYTPVEDRWASIEPLTVKERLIAATAQVVSDITHKITMLYRKDLISQQDQIHYQGRVFEVAGRPINPGEQQEELICLCVERT